MSYQEHVLDSGEDAIARARAMLQTTEDSH